MFSEDFTLLNWLEQIYPTTYLQIEKIYLKSQKIYLEIKNKFFKEK